MFLALCGNFIAVLKYLRCLATMPEGVYHKSNEVSLETVWEKKEEEEDMDQGVILRQVDRKTFPLSTPPPPVEADTVRLQQQSSSWSNPAQTSARLSASLIIFGGIAVAIF